MFVGYLGVGHGCFRTDLLQLLNPQPLRFSVVGQLVGSGPAALQFGCYLCQLGPGMVYFVLKRIPFYLDGMEFPRRRLTGRNLFGQARGRLAAGG